VCSVQGTMRQVYKNIIPLETQNDELNYVYFKGHIQTGSGPFHFNPGMPLR